MYRMVGRGRPWSVRGLSRATSIPEVTLNNYRRGESLPGEWNAHLLRKILGPEFVNPILAVAGLGGAFAISVNGCPYEVNQWSARYVAAFAEAANDNGLDHRSYETLARIAGPLTSAAAAMANRG